MTKIALAAALAAEDEYRHAVRAFEKLIRPHVDKRLVRKAVLGAELPPRNTVVRREP